MQSGLFGALYLAWRCSRLLDGWLGCGVVGTAGFKVDPAQVSEKTDIGRRRWCQWHQ